MFADVMHEVVQRCVDAGLVSGKAIGVDGTQATANAASNSLTPIAAVISVTQWVTRKQEANETEDVTTEPPTAAGDGPGRAGSGDSAPSGTVLPALVGASIAGNAVVYVDMSGIQVIVNGVPDPLKMAAA